MCSPLAYSVTKNNARNAPKPFSQKSLKNFWKGSTAQIPSVIKEKPLPTHHPKCPLQQDFFRAKAECFAHLSHHLGVRPFARLSVCLSHSWSVSNRCKLGSRNVYCELTQGLVTKFRATGCRDFPRTRASKRGNPKKTSFCSYWLE